METTDNKHQQALAVIKSNLDSLERLTEQIMENASVNLEFELREERIAPYRVDITKYLPPVEPLIAIDGKVVCSAGNISAIVGEAKSKKTFLTTALVASSIAYLYPDSEAFDNVANDITLKVLWLDTEQGEMHVRKVIERSRPYGAAQFPPPCRAA